jgi:membrane protease subunit (stomatin/prohibitin family)
VHLDRFSKIDYATQTTRLKAWVDRFKPTTVIAEENSMGGPLIEQLQREGVQVQPFNTTSASKNEAIQALAMAFEKGDIHIIPDQVAIGELQAYEQERLSSGMFKYGAPKDSHDDTVMALAIGWQAVASGGGWGW